MGNVRDCSPYVKGVVDQDAFCVVLLYGNLALKPQSCIMKWHLTWAVWCRVAQKWAFCAGAGFTLFGHLLLCLCLQNLLLLEKWTGSVSEPGPSLAIPDLQSSHTLRENTSRHKPNTKGLVVYTTFRCTTKAFQGAALTCMWGIPAPAACRDPEQGRRKQQAAHTGHSSDAPARSCHKAPQSNCTSTCHFPGGVYFNLSFKRDRIWQNMEAYTWVNSLIPSAAEVSACPVSHGLVCKLCKIIRSRWLA